MTGEEIAVAADRLRAVAGVLDLVDRPGPGKKGRLMQSFRLLVAPGRADAVVERCFLETSTIGLRWRTKSASCCRAGRASRRRRRRHRRQDGRARPAGRTQGGERRSGGRQPRGAPPAEARWPRRPRRERMSRRRSPPALSAATRHLAIAVSGGVDSMTLAAFAHRCAEAAAWVGRDDPCGFARRAAGRDRAGARQGRRARAGA